MSQGMDGIIVGLQFGNVTLSFKTDDRGSNIKKRLETIAEIVISHKALFKKFSEENLWTPTITKHASGKTLAQKGKAETSVILRRIEDRLLQDDFFKSGKTTGDVKAKLRTETDIDFTSRKVSQALGVLFTKGVLSRVGSKGNFRYVQQ